MDLELEAARPYDQSSLWRIHDAYFAGRGGEAWTQGEIPSEATSNYAMARQQARLLIALVADLEALRSIERGGEVAILEVGSGSGKFAAMFLRALEKGCGERGRALLARVRYVMSDYSEKSLRDAVADTQLDLARHVESGTLVPALLDLRKPRELRPLDGRKAPARFAAAIANYVCCVTPTKVLLKNEKGWYDRRVRISLETELASGETAEAAGARHLKEAIENATRPELMKKLTLSFEWGQIDLDEAFRDAVDRDTVVSTVEGFKEATIHYPYGFLGFARSLGDRLVKGGALIVNDYGTATLDELESEKARPPAHYGNTLNHGVDFAVLDTFCKRAGLSVERTRNPLFRVHSAMIQFAPEVTPGARKEFQKVYVKHDDGQIIVELHVAAAAAKERGDHASCARLLERCVRLDPTSARLHWELGAACYDAGQPRLALRYLEKGRRLAAAERFDFQFVLGRVYFQLGRHEDAKKAFEASLAVEPNASTHANLARVLELLGDRKAAFKSYRRVLEANPDGPVAAVVVTHLVREYLPQEAP